MSDHDPESTLPVTDRLTDASDRATQAEMEANDDALRAVRRAMKRQQEPGPDGAYPYLDCDDCGDEIGAQRLAVAIKNRWCIHCATVREIRR